MIEIYGKDRCTSCSASKAFCEANGVEYVYKSLNKDYTFTEFSNKAPENFKSFPLILKNGAFLGGYSDLVKHVKN